MELADWKNKLLKTGDGGSHLWIFHIYVNCIYQLFECSFMKNENRSNERYAILCFHFLDSKWKNKRTIRLTLISLVSWKDVSSYSDINQATQKAKTQYLKYRFLFCREHKKVT